MELKQLPQSLSDITLEKWVGWHEEYGAGLLAKTKGQMSDDELLLFEVDFHSKNYAYYTDTELEEVIAAKADIIEIVKASAIFQAQLFSEMQIIGHKDLVNAEFDFVGWKWKIQSPVSVANQSEVTIKEFDVIQEVSLLLVNLQEGELQSLYKLCELYLHPISGKGELLPLERQMKTLPLSIALCVKKYVEDTINLYHALVNDRKPTVS